MSDLFLLCDLVHHVDFAKVNLDILKQIKKDALITKYKAKQFRKASGLAGDGYITHDGITHQNIPAYIGRKLDPKFKTKEKYTPLNKFIDNDNNYNIESVADGIEAVKRPTDVDITNTRMYNAGRALRKRKLSDSDKLLLTDSTGTAVKILNGAKPSQKDVDTILNSLKERGQQPKQQPKIKGSKPQETTIEEKQQKLRQKYGIL